MMQRLFIPSHTMVYEKIMLGRIRTKKKILRHELQQLLNFLKKSRKINFLCHAITKMFLSVTFVFWKKFSKENLNTDVIELNF